MNLKSTKALHDLKKASHADARKFIAYIPVGCIEQHGPYLPIETDSIIAMEMAKQIATMSEPNFMGYVFQCINYSPCRSNISYCGTVSIAEDVFREYVKEICYSILNQDKFDAIVLVCGHGSAAPSLIEVAYKIVDQQFREHHKVIKPVIVLNIMDVNNQLHETFSQQSGRHADWREFLFLYNVLGTDYFSPNMLKTMESFMNSNDFTQSQVPIIGVPMEKRSIDGVVGQPLPLESDWYKMSQKIWDVSTEYFSNYLEMILRGYEQIR